MRKYIYCATCIICIHIHNKGADPELQHKCSKIRPVILGPPSPPGRVQEPRPWSGITTTHAKEIKHYNTKITTLLI